MSVVNCAKTSLPRSLDVPVSLSRTVAETATDMTMLCFVTPGVNFPPGNDRVQFFSTFESVQNAVPENSEAIFAAQAFFNRTDRPSTMCIGRVFTEPTQGSLVSGTTTPSRLANVTNGGFNISVGTETYTVNGLNFGASPTLNDVISQLNDKMGDYAEVSENEDEESLMINTKIMGDGADISYASTPATPTDVSSLLALTASEGAAVEEGTVSTAAKITSGAITLSKLYNVSDGAMTISINGDSVNLYNLDFTSYGEELTLSNVVQVLTDAFASNATVSLQGSNIVISTTQTGEGVTIGYGTLPASVYDLSSLLALSEGTAASRIDGYTPGGLMSEVALIQTASRCAGHSVFAWTLDRQYRDTDDQKSFADWTEAQDQGYFSACTNSVQAYNTADVTNIGFYAYNKGYIKTSVMYHNNPQVYPDVSYAALALSVNYALENSTLTMKFKQLTGIETVPLTETQLSALKARRINSYVSMGNSSSVIREGVQSADSWFTDSHVNLSNYKEELQVEVFNVFMRNKKVQYTSAGQDLLVSAATKINNRYIRNGTFADREEETTDNETGYTTLPACTITPAPIYSATASERANRVAPPIAITAYEAGAFHSVEIDVTVYN